MVRAPLSRTDWPLVIGHRGAPGYMPEHTLAGYRLAAEMGADFIEPDLVFTRDGELVVRHDNYLSDSTDVADRPEFAGRRQVKPGREEPDWFTEDFTLEELKDLRTRQAFPGRTKALDGRYDIPTFDDVLKLAKTLSAELGRTIGVYPETKRPGYFKDLGYDFLPPLLATLDRHDIAGRSAPVIVQSFEPEMLARLRPATDTRLMLLLDEDADVSVARLGNVAEIADGIGPIKSLLVTPERRPSSLIADAHAAGLFVHAWTFRNDQLPPGITDARLEYEFFYDLGVDGVFSDFADTAHAVRLIRRARAR